MASLGRTLIAAGLALAGVGVMLAAGFRLPGDIFYKGRHVTVFVPWVTMLAVSLIASLLMYLFTRR